MHQSTRASADDSPTPRTIFERPEALAAISVQGSRACGILLETSAPICWGANAADATAPAGARLAFISTGACPGAGSRRGLCGAACARRFERSDRSRRAVTRRCARRTRRSTDGWPMHDRLGRLTCHHRAVVAPLSAHTAHQGAAHRGLDGRWHRALASKCGRLPPAVWAVCLCTLRAAVGGQAEGGSLQKHPRHSSHSDCGQPRAHAQAMSRRTKSSESQVTKHVQCRSRRSRLHARDIAWLFVKGRPCPRRCLLLRLALLAAHKPAAQSLSVHSRYPLINLAAARAQPPHLGDATPTVFPAVAAERP